MKRYNFLYRDGANYKTYFTFDTDLDLSPGQEITIEELGMDQRIFFETLVGFSYNAEYDHDLLEVVDEVDSINGVYLMTPQMLPADYTLALNASGIYTNQMKEKYPELYALHLYRGFFIIEQVPGASVKYLLDVIELYGKKYEDNEISELTKQIDKYLDGDKPSAVKASPETDTTKYIVAYMLKSEMNRENLPDIDHYEAFIEWEEIDAPYAAPVDPDDYNEPDEPEMIPHTIAGRSPKELATEFYKKLLEDPDTYTANLCLIVESTDYF